MTKNDKNKHKEKFIKQYTNYQNKKLRGMIILILCYETKPFNSKFPSFNEIDYFIYNKHLYGGVYVTT